MSELLTKQGALELLSKTCDNVRAIFEDCGEVHAAFIVVARNDMSSGERLDEPTVVPFVVPLGDAPQKDFVAALLRRITAVTNAAGIIQISECWYVPYKPGESHEDGIAPIDHPRRQEAVFVFMEHVALGKVARSAEIERDDQGHGTLGEFTNMEGVAAGGRFSDLLPVQAYGRIKGSA